MLDPTVYSNTCCMKNANYDYYPTETGYTVKERLFDSNLVTSVSCLFCVIKYSGVPLPALYSNSDWIFQNIN